MRLCMGTVCCVFTVSFALGGKDERMWEKEEMNWRHVETLKELKGNKTEIFAHATLSSLTVELDGSKIWSEKLPLHRNKTMDRFGRYASVAVVVLSTLKRPPAVVASRKFMTGQPSEVDKLIAFLKSLQEGRVAILVGIPNFLAYMNDEVRQLLREAGSNYITKIAPGDSWLMAWLTREGDPRDRERRRGHREMPRQNLIKAESFLRHLERLNHNTDQPLSGARVLAEVVITKSLAIQRSSSVSFYVDLTGENLRCKWHHIPHLKAQSDFCGTYDGYDTLCSCHSPFIPLNRTKPAPIPMAEAIPIVIVTANKPFHLYRLFRNLDLVRGAAETQILVVVDGYHPETIRLCQLFGVDFRVHKPQGYPKENTRTNMNIGFSLWAAYNHFPSANKMILLEDDLLLSPDLLSFFHQTSHLLDEDETLSHINAFGQNSYPLTAANLSTVLRVEMYPQYGWLTTRRWFSNISSYWVREGKDIDWDWWLINEGPKMGQHSVVPEVSRTGHAGSAGAHVSGYQQFYYFHPRIQSNAFQEMPIIDTERLSSPKKYEEWMENEIRRSEKLHLQSSPCAYNVFPSNKTGPFVLYLGVTSKSDGHDSFYLMQTCFGTDETDLKELYDGIMRLNLLPVTGSLQKAKERDILYMVGCPLSSLCKFSEKMADWIVPPSAMLRNIQTAGFWRRHIDLEK